MNPTRLRDREIIRSNSKITTQVHREMKILPVHSISKIPVIHKRNGIIGELHKAKKIVSNFDIQIKSIINKYTGTGFFSRFARSTINHFDSGKDNLTV